MAMNWAPFQHDYGWSRDMGPDHFGRQDPQPSDAVTATLNKVVDGIMKVLLEAVHEVIETEASFGGMSQVHKVERVIELFETCAEPLADRMEYHIYALRRRRNAALPIHHLPLEVLVNIFSYVTLPPTTIYTQLHPLAQVSSTWANIVKGTPELWSYAHSEYPAWALSACLSRSKSHPLTVTYHEVNPTIGIALSTRDSAFMDAVCPTSHRWRSAAFLVHTHLPLPYITMFAAPRLEDLVIESRGEVEQGGLDLFQGTANRLQNVVLTRCGVRWDSGVLAGLRNLQLSQLQFVGPTIQQLVEMLRMSPALESLSLDEVNLDGAAEELTEVDDPIHLPVLRVCSLNLRPGVTRFILTHVRLTVCSYLVIRCDCVDDSTTEVLDASTSHLLPTIRSIIQSSRHLYLRLGATVLECAMVPDMSIPLGLSITIDNQPPVDTLAWLVGTDPSIFRSSPITLNLEGSQELWETWGLMPILRILTSTIELIIMNAEDSVIDSLSDPYLLEGRPHWPFPELKSLIILEGSFGADNLIRALKFRYGAMNAGGVRLSRRQVPKTLPRRIGKLVLQACQKVDERSIRTIRAIIGFNAVEFHEHD